MHIWIIAELGDYDATIHTPAFVSEFRFVPEQTEDMEIKIIEEYKKIRFLFWLYIHIYMLLLLNIFTCLNLLTYDWIW